MPRSHLYLGGFILLAGLLLLLNNLGVLGGAEHFVWTILFGLGGLAFLLVSLLHREHWWALIPGFVLLSLAAVIAVGDQPDLGDWGGTIFLGGIGLAFWVIYATHPGQWWAMFPGGVLLTLAAVAGPWVYLSGNARGGVFFLGLALTFGLVGTLPTTEGRQRWAYIPGLALLAPGLLLLAAGTDLAGFVWPGLLILAGICLLVWNLRPAAKS